MIIIFSIIFLSFIVFVRRKQTDKFSILDKSTTKSIEGYLAVYIIFSHLRQYIPYDDIWSDKFILILNLIGQMCVAPFFFFSGFGIITSVKNKGEAYSKTILINRFLRVWIWFIIALVPFYLLDILWLHKFSSFDYLLAPFGFTSIGNSNWFLSTILLSYLSIGLSFLIFRKRVFRAILLSSFIILLYVILAFIFKFPTWWFDTVLCFPLGMICAFFRNKIETLLSDAITRIFLIIYSLVFILISYLFPRYISARGEIIHILLRNLLICILILTLSSVFCIRHKVFERLGACSFSIFIYQRIPMIILKESNLLSDYKYLYWILCISSAIVIGCLIQKVYKRFDSLFIDNWYKKISTKYAFDCISDTNDNDFYRSSSDIDKTNIHIGIFINYLSFFVAILGTFIVTKRVLLFVGDKEYGLYSFVLSITSWVTVITAAINSSFIRFSVQQTQKEGNPNRTNTIYFKVFCFFSFITLVLGSLILFVLNFLKVKFTSYSWEESQYIYILLFISLISICITIPGTFFSLFISYNKKFIFANSFALLFTILGYIAQFFIAFYTKRIIGIAIYTIVSSICICIGNFLYSKKKLALSFLKTRLVDNKTLLYSISAFSSIVIFNVVVDQINSQVDKTILGFLGLPASVTIYQLGQSLAAYLTSVSVAVSGPFAPSINECISKKDFKGINDIYLKVSRFQIIIVVMIAFGFLSCGREVILMWLGEEYYQVYYIGSALMLLNICPLTINISIEIQRAQNKHLFRAVVYFVIAIINVIASISFICVFPQGYEIYGCLLGTIIATILSHWILMNWYNYKKMNLPVDKYLVFLFKHIVFGLIAYIIIFLINHFNLFPINTFICFIFKGVLFVFVYLICVFVFDKSILPRFKILKEINK